MATNSITWVGMDAHKDSIKVAVLLPERSEPVEWTEATAVEAAWHQRFRPALSVPLRRQREGQAARVLAIAGRAQERLYARCRRMELQGKASPKIIVAPARELTGHLWAVLHPAAAARV